ncbi:unnamed protein product [Albugo candida]|uniref:Alkyl hydroperoxide reductase subunit C/ Thiol specific antioxidant domain-containing protein n=1 Tax=Albugo candida TaxID=65357 RepID=A0A024GPJ6_9STRA|nr:unnamed protein product [Albugo candida]|eukprot:CCI48724.1 unnamed protein product [Albugo candida]
MIQVIHRDQLNIFHVPTPGCTTQAKAFNTIIDAIQKDGFRVHGVSADPPRSLKVWKDQHSFAFDLLSDPKHSLIGYFGSSVNKTSINRSHAIVLQGGEIADIQHNMKPEESAEKAFAYVKAHPVA